MASKAQKTKQVKAPFDPEEAYTGIDNYLDIWHSHPSFKDVNKTVQLAKRLSLLALIAFITIGTQALTVNPYYSISIGILFLISFAFVFKGTLNVSMGSRIRRVHPFQGLLFWMNRKEPTTLYITNKTEGVNVAVKIIKMEVMPENVKPTISQFISALASQGLSFTYQVIQQPLIKYFNDRSSRNVTATSINSYRMELYFAVSERVSGMVKSLYMSERAGYLQRFLKSTLVANFHHFKFSILEGVELANAIRLVALGDVLPDSTKTEIVSKENLKPFIVKLCYFIVLLAYASYLLIQLNVDFIWLVVIESIISIMIFALWWRNLTSAFLLMKINSNKDLVAIEPFGSVRFYKSSYCPDSLLIHVNGDFMVNLKSFQVKQVVNDHYVYPDKLFQAIIAEKLPVMYSLMARPIPVDEFERDGRAYMNYRSQKATLKYQTLKEWDKWLKMRRGMWGATITMSVSSHKHCSTVMPTDLWELEHASQENIAVLSSIFESNFPGYYPELLDSKQNMRAFQCNSMKIRNFKLIGTKLREVWFQGKILQMLISPVDELKKGIPTKVAAEFNTPLRLYSDILIGNTLNTEFLEEEIPAGFMNDQSEQLLIANGTEASQELVLLKVLEGRIKQGLPSIYFDLSGNGSKVINVFRNTQFEGDIYHFKVGTAFNLKLLKSELPYDTQEHVFSDFVIEAFGLVYKKDQRAIDNLRGLISSAPMMDYSSLDLKNKSKNSYESNPAFNSAANLFTDFIQNNHDLLLAESNEEHPFPFKDILNNQKTIIMDLTKMTDLPSKLFGMYVLLSKIVYYLSEGFEYEPKLMIIPYLDMMFNTRHLEYYGGVNYGKIDKFLAPLQQRKFGILGTAGQISYVHPHVFKYFSNVITFKTSHYQDVSTVKALMGLQELEGSGYYSRTRNTTYQLDFLKSMKPNQILVKRDDIDQVFPVQIDEKYKEVPRLAHEELLDHMEQLGFDFRTSEKRLFAHAKQTILESDLGQYMAYKTPIIKFLEGVKKVENVGNNHEAKLKEQLLDALYPEANRRIQGTNKKRKISGMRDEIYDRLIQKQYLVETHPRMASGGQAIRSSFKVGEQFERAITDYYETKKEMPVKMDVMAKETKEETFTNLFAPKRESVKAPDPAIEELEFREKLLTGLGRKLLYSLYEINKKLSEGDVEGSRAQARSLLPSFVVGLYKEFFEKETKTGVSSDDLTNPIKFLASKKSIPYSEAQLLSIIEKTSNIDQGEESVRNAMDDIRRFIFAVQSMLSTGVAVPSSRPSKAILEEEEDEKQEEEMPEDITDQLYNIEESEEEEEEFKATDWLRENREKLRRQDDVRQ